MTLAKKQKIRDAWKHVVVFLQNAWSPAYAGGEWPRVNWLLALQGSRSGKRLRTLVADLECCHNTTPIVGATSSSVVPPEVQHIGEILAERRPTVVVACGKQAEKALLAIWPGILLAVPHPAARVLTNDLYREARTFIETPSSIGRTALRQCRGFVERVDL